MNIIAQRVSLYPNLEQKTGVEGIDGTDSIRDDLADPFNLTSDLPPVNPSKRTD